MANSNVQVLVSVAALPGKEKEVTSLLLQLVGPSRQEEGCIRYELLQNHVEPTEFVFIEEWESEVALMGHIDSIHVQEIFRELGNLLATPPVIHRYQVLA
ncbi:putative quinol monooxygenase [Calothrix sp. UHCC 0171]|uniref:putative quinol monooxygenase n=1 Tax=Calothrix sp. UHCC 0171 TaxID=3110245 RepID=UPI002B1F41EA|nr:putative quinol monooxygenase [Calothrix sp. UHCC 0171]MEA5570601.1 putative quinol monooxygenase [Calothrix sp. UHCC 0171]